MNRDQEGLQAACGPPAASRRHLVAGAGSGGPHSRDASRHWSPLVLPGTRNLAVSWHALHQPGPGKQSRENSRDTGPLPLLPCLLAWSSSRGSPTPFPDLPTPPTRPSYFKKIKLFSCTPLDNQVEESQSASGFYQHSYIFTRPYCIRLFGVLLIVLGLSL